MHKILSLTIVILIFITVFAKVSRAEVSVGIWPAKIEVNTHPYKTTFAEIYMFNPGDIDIKTMIEFYCENCKRDILLFNHKIGAVTTDIDVEIKPSLLVIKENTSPYNPEKVEIVVHNKPLMKKYFEKTLFGKKISIPFYSITFDKNEFDGKIIATTQETRMALSITSEAKINIYGINKFIFIISIILLIFLISLAIHEYYRRKALKLR